MTWDKIWPILAGAGLLVVLIGGGVLVDLGLSNGSSSSSTNRPQTSVPAATLNTSKPTTSAQTSTTSTTAGTTTSSDTSSSATSSNATDSTSEGMDALLALWGQSIANVQCDYTVSGEGTNETSHLWIKQDMLKIRTVFTEEGSIFSGSMVILIDSKNRTAAMYSEEEKWGISFPFEDASSPADSWATDIVQYAPKIIGYETIDGKPCTILEYTADNDTGAIITKMWLWNQNGFPIKEESTVNGKTTTTTYTNITFNTVTDADFARPSDIVFSSF